MRFYKAPNGASCPSVTTILGKCLPHKGLDIWKRRTPNWKEISKHAATKGTFMHYRILDGISEIPLPVPEINADEWPEDLVAEMEQREDAWRQLGLKISGPKRIEYTIYHTIAPLYAGTLDMRAKIDRVHTLADLKSSARFYDSHYYQLGGYYRGLMLMHPAERIERGMIIRIRGGDAEISEIELSELIEYGNKFIELANTFHHGH